MDSDIQKNQFSSNDLRSQPDLTTNYRPLGIKAVVAACVFVKSDERLPISKRAENDTATGDPKSSPASERKGIERGTDIIARLSRLSDPDTSEPE
ncbi:hypothetical protein DXT96_25935 [Agrobacterium sp. ICMP 6402]|nr:hypothetical protein [Allorhizobium ampelinum]MQB13280.1 hypothetical protein [Agrobacterium sp. ICMP 6402]UVY99326.1 hypothetical protein K4M20_00053 [Agrobacterium fabrum]UVY99715.1 hypothetical protein K4M19_00025 [Agrobacterium fabrum]